jgi:hypothetical protein
MIFFQCLEKLRKLLSDKTNAGSDTTENKKRKLEVEKDLLKVLAYRAEAVSSQ